VGLLVEGALCSCPLSMTLRNNNTSLRKEQVNSSSGTRKRSILGAAKIRLAFQPAQARIDLKGVGRGERWVGGELELRQMDHSRLGKHAI
jgi:hypothetical protein